MQRLAEGRQRGHEDVLEHVADDQHRQGVRNEEDGSEAVLEGDFGVQQHRQEHAEDVRAERDQNRDENREQIRVADACVLEHRDVVLEADELVIAVTLRIGERVHRALQERQVQEDAHENHRGNGHPVERRIDLALGVFRNLLRLLCGGLVGLGRDIASHCRSSPHLKFLASILSYSDCMLFRNRLVLPDCTNVCRKPARLMLAGT